MSKLRYVHPPSEIQRRREPGWIHRGPDGSFDWIPDDPAVAHQVDRVEVTVVPVLLGAAEG